MPRVYRVARKSCSPLNCVGPGYSVDGIPYCDDWQWRSIRDNSLIQLPVPSYHECWITYAGGILFPPDIENLTQISCSTAMRGYDFRAYIEVENAFSGWADDYDGGYGGEVGAVAPSVWPIMIPTDPVTGQQ